MQAEIPQAMHQKLRIVEKETKFLASKPAKPKRYSLYYGLLVLVVFLSVAIILVVKGTWADEPTLFMLCSLQIVSAVSTLSSYSDAKRLYDLHNTARELIEYYKEQHERPSTSATMS